MLQRLLGATLVAAALVSGAYAAPTAVAPLSTDESVATAALGAAIKAALASPGRPEADRLQDPARHPLEVLGFLGARPGLRVIDVFAAGGYYTELLARVVGAKGRVVAYNNPPYAKFAAQGIAERHAGGRLANVRNVTAEVDELQLEPQSLDAALFVMSYHDAYWRPDDGSWDRTKPDVLLGKIHAALVPGAVVVVQDHVAAAGGDPTETAGRLHRIDPAVVRRDFERAGFVFEAASDVLRNPRDDHDKLVFDESVRGRTDQFVYRFRKPLP